jgi:hypothetical protein
MKLPVIVEDGRFIRIQWVDLDSQPHNGTVANSGRDAGVDHAGAMSAVHAGLRRGESVPEV